MGFHKENDGAIQLGTNALFRIAQAGSHRFGGVPCLLRKRREPWLARRTGPQAALCRSSPISIPHGPSQNRSLEFVSGSLSCSRRFRRLSVIDNFIRGCLAAIADTSLPGIKAARELDRIAGMRGLSVHGAVGQRHHTLVPAA